MFAVPGHGSGMLRDARPALKIKLAGVGSGHVQRCLGIVDTEAQAPHQEFPMKRTITAVAILAALGIAAQVQAHDWGQDQRGRNHDWRGRDSWRDGDHHHRAYRRSDGYRRDYGYPRNYGYSRPYGYWHDYGYPSGYGYPSRYRYDDCDDYYGYGDSDISLLISLPLRF